MRGYTTRPWKTVLTVGILAPALAAVITPLALRAERQAPAPAPAARRSVAASCSIT